MGRGRKEDWMTRQDGSKAIWEERNLVVFYAKLGGD